MRHVMLDLETYGVNPGCAVLAIGAQEFEFDLDNSIGRSYYRNVDPMTCWSVGLKMEESTRLWWLEQSPEARALLTENQAPLAEAVREFHRWWMDCEAEYVWCNGAAFDEPIWRVAARAVQLDVPWRYGSVRCMRTLCAMANINHKAVPHEGVEHHALADAAHQIVAVQRAYRKIAAVGAC